MLDVYGLVFAVPRRAVDLGRPALPNSRYALSLCCELSVQVLVMDVVRRRVLSETVDIVVHFDVTGNVSI